MQILQARSADDLEAARALFREYDSSLDVDLSVQGLAAEIAGLPGLYAPPKGALFLARDAGGEAVGCLGVRPFGRPDACELKRLYVRPPGRGKGTGAALLAAALAFAREAGYREVLLDSLADMTAAIGLYRRFGFRVVPPYWNNTLPGVLYFGRRLEEP